jgi:hypothetical protein
MSHISDDNKLYFWYIYLLFIGSKITPSSSSTLTKIFTAYWLINNSDDIVHKETLDFNENTYNISIKHK